MNELAVVPFYFQEKEVRAITIGDEPWFVARDVCAILGLDNVTNAIARVPENHKGVNPINTPGGIQQMITVDEPGLYRLILRSDKPQAEPFMEWVTEEVLPTIRKTGSYGTVSDDELQRSPVVLNLLETQGKTLLLINELARSMKQLLPSAAQPRKQGKPNRAIGRFIDDCCVVDGAQAVDKAKLYQEYQDWCFGEQELVEEYDLFFKLLYGQGYPMRSAEVKGRKAVKGICLQEQS